MSEAPVFEARDLRFSYAGASQPAIDAVDLRVDAGSLYAVIGPNGSGKSTLLKLLLGALQPDEGSVVYRGLRLVDWSRRSLAQQIGVVPQGEGTAFPITVRELVAMGRYPHLGLLQRPRPADRAAIEEAMDRCDVIDVAERPIATLSGGERQRALIARALAQQPAALVLDEPTVSLDIRHEMEIFELLARFTQNDDVTVVLVTHHINLAARYADRLLLLDRGLTAAEGGPSDVVAREIIEQVYGWSVVVSPHPGPGRDAGAPQILPLTGEAVDSLPTAPRRTP